MGMQCEENWCLYEILKFAIRVCLQKCSALSLNLKICSIFSAFNSAHNAFAEQMQQCYTALGIARQSSEKNYFLEKIPNFSEKLNDYVIFSHNLLTFY